MRLTYGQTEATLVSHLQIHPDKVGTLRSRIKQLQRLGFPPGVNVGRGTKMEYSGEHLFMLVTAFELIGIGLPAQTACNLVSEHWPVFRGGYALAALQARRPFDTKAEHILAILWIKALHEIQVNTSYGTNKHSKIKVSDESAAVRELKPYEFEEDSTRLFISVGKLLERVLKIAFEQSGVRDATIYDDEFQSWLPTGRHLAFDFVSHYPDRSNLKMRQHLQSLYGNDPDSFTPDGMEEASDFVARGYQYAGPL